jgi:hypothetical protein
VWDPTQKVPFDYMYTLVRSSTNTRRGMVCIPFSFVFFPSRWNNILHTRTQNRHKQINTNRDVVDSFPSLYFFDSLVVCWYL